VSEILPPEPSRRIPDDGSAIPPDPEVGFAPGSPLTMIMLARYLVGRAIAARLSVSLMVLALVLVAGAVALWIWVSHVLAILVGIVALMVLLFRALVMAILRRVLSVDRLGSAEAKVRSLVSDTSGDLRRELRRVGLPGSVLGMPLLMVRLIGRRRRATLAKLAQFEVTNVVPRSRLDELHFIVRNDVLGR
jgi:hypothetical protein